MRKATRSCLLVFLAVLLLCGLSYQSASLQSGNDIRSPSSSKEQKAYKEFTVEALEAYTRERYIASRSQGLEDIRPLGSGEFSGTGIITIDMVANLTHRYDITYMCNPQTAASFSIRLRRGGASYWAADIGECPGEGVFAISVPVERFPKATEVVFNANGETSFIVVIHEIMVERKSNE